MVLLTVTWAILHQLATNKYYAPNMPVGKSDQDIS